MLSLLKQLPRLLLFPWPHACSLSRASVDETEELVTVATKATVGAVDQHSVWLVYSLQLSASHQIYTCRVKSICLTCLCCGCGCSLVLGVQASSWCGRRTYQDFSCVILRWGTAVFSCLMAYIQLLEKCHGEWRSALLQASEAVRGNLPCLKALTHRKMKALRMTPLPVCSDSMLKMKYIILM